MIGSKIIASAEPRGHYEGVIISGTPLPGTVMEIVPSTLPVNGRFTYRACTRANGAKGGHPVLLEDEEQGMLPTTAYVSGTRGKVYWPMAGEELNMLVNYSAGTGTAGEYNVGDALSIQNDGVLIATTGTSAPFQLLEFIGIMTTDSLMLCKYLGNNA